MKPNEIVKRVDEFSSFPEEWVKCFHVVLVTPIIPQNTGNIGRLCAGSSSVLHLVEPLGFSLSDRYVKRAGLDYWSNVDLVLHKSFDTVETLFEDNMYLFSTKGNKCYTEITWTKPGALVFGSETKGLSEEIREYHQEKLVRIPITEHVRSLNLANSVAIALYDALRQRNFSSIISNQ